VAVVGDRVGTRRQGDMESSTDRVARSWQSALADSPQLAFVMDLRRRVVAVSAGLADALGTAPDELVGHRCSEFMHGSDTTHESCPLHALLLDSAQREAEVHSQALGCDLLVTVTPLPDDGGVTTLVLHTAVDLSEMRRTDVARREEEERYRRDLEKSAALLGEAEKLAHLGSWEWDVVSGETNYSQEWRRIHGLGADGVPMPEILGLCHPADAETLWQAIRKLREEKAPVAFDHRIVRADGEVRHLSAVGRPLLGEDGDIEKIQGASLDVTDRVIAQSALLERERRLQRALAGAVSALATTVEMRDPYTSGHQRRVAELAVRIAQLLGWPEERTDDVQVAALLHDIGKVVVPSEILSKPTRLSDHEFEIIKGHALAAAEILAPVEFDGPVQEAILQHHERLDGSGYPRGLRGDEVIPEARVLAVADVYEAMISHRPYRPGVAREDVFAELRGGAGGRYDTAAVEVCLGLIEQGFEFSQVEQ
jgi:putative nucleotidyltransferase with HDIG domain/PAS domain S-box-containing protein